MRDLTAILKAVVAGRPAWSEDRAQRLFDTVAARYAQPELDWDTGASNWQDIGLGRDIAFSVNSVLPLCLAPRAHAITIAPLAHDAGALLIAYARFDEPCCAEPGLLDAVTGEAVETAPEGLNMDPANFSLQDLWYHTIQTGW